MSSRLGLNSLSGVQEILVILLMLISFVAIFYSDIETIYKIGIAVLVFGVVFLANIATQILKGVKTKRVSNEAGAQDIRKKL